MTVAPITLTQTIVLLALSRNEQPPVFPPITRRELLRKRWIAPSGREAGSVQKRRHDITEAGSRALATSPHLGQAQRALDEGKQDPTWK